MRPERFLAAAGLLMAGAAYGLARHYKGRIALGRAIAARTRGAESHPENPVATLIVLGDSTGVGVGADQPSESVAGRIAARHPTLRVCNYAVSGAQACHLAEQLDRHGEGPIDIALVQCCANDVRGDDPVEQVERDLEATVVRCRARGAFVAIMPGCNFSHAPFFRPLFAPPRFNRRALALHAMIHRVAERHGAVYVDLFDMDARHHFFNEGGRYFCADGLHPSGEGYRVWFERLVGHLPIAMPLTSSRDQFD